MIYVLEGFKKDFKKECDKTINEKDFKKLCSNLQKYCTTDYTSIKKGQFITFKINSSIIKYPLDAFALIDKPVETYFMVKHEAFFNHFKSLVFKEEEFKKFYYKYIYLDLIYEDYIVCYKGIAERITSMHVSEYLEAKELKCMNCINIHVCN